MEPSYKDMLLQILTVMEYEEKEKYAAEFEEMNLIQAMMNCLEMLPDSIKKKIKAKQIDVHEVVKTIPKDLFEPELIKVSAKALFDLLHQMEALLSMDQKEKIADVFASFAQ